ncbi:MAG: transcription-repair coupling factor [Deltaproteobacteria bacterium]
MDESSDPQGAAVSAAAAAASLAPRLVGGAREHIGGVRGPARAALLAALARARPRPMLVLAPDQQAADSLAQDLIFFLGEDICGDALAKRVHVLPAWDVAPFAPISPSPETVAQRIEGFYHLSQTTNPIVITTPDAAMQRAMSPELLMSAVQYLVEGDDVDLTDLAARLADWGYRRRALVEDRGELAVRGGLIDVFVTGHQDPLRIELFGDTIESIRSFDPRSQRRLGECEEALILPASELPLHARSDRAALRRLEDRARDLEMTRAERLNMLDQVREGLHFPGLEALSPLLTEMVGLPAYLPADALVVLDDAVALDAAAADTWSGVEAHEHLAIGDRRLHAPAEALFLTPAALQAGLAKRPILVLDGLDAPGGKTERIAAKLPFAIRGQRMAHEEKGFAALASRVRAWEGEGARVALVVGTVAQAERLKHIMEAEELPVDVSGESLPLALELRDAPGTFIVEGELSESIELPGDRLVCIAETNLFGEHRHTRRRKRVALTLDQVMKSLEQLKPKDFIVHIDHGIGRYHGLTHLNVAGSEGDYLLLEYHGGDKLYLPVDRVNLVQKYVGGDGAHPELAKLGSATWGKLKEKTKESILSMTRELLALYSNRQRNVGYSFSSSDPYYQEFEARFPFDETPDQERAIKDMLEDLGKSKPMDRLICGDVGYGKTEVAMRGAFAVAMDGKQVAVLVPTTVLAQQHVESFRKRFEGYPIRVESMSGFRSRKENLETAKEIEQGKVDIVIGTHRLLSGDIEFSNLGLLVIDEEHRFGVKDKERIKQLRQLVDVLTLTATPIPRTLEMSLSGIRDLSVIETPPVDRQAIRTYVTRSDDHVIRDAILRELRRGGQVFFVHNRVQSIEALHDRLRAIVPEAKIRVGHGQMKAHELERVMIGFMEHEFDVLLCTAIVESGLDIPNANTIFIDRADTFGLAQLYQLRGRVGRSPARAYAYLLIPDQRVLTRDAQMRLQVLQELDELGGGFKIAAHDLEIRGAGNLLGKQQSGHITEVGFELYTKMMEDAVHELRGEAVEPDIEPEIQIAVPAYIPDSYIDDVNQRLIWYKRLAVLRSEEDRESFAAELRDRYGPLPAIVDTLLDVMELRRRMKKLALSEAKLRGPLLSLRLHPTSEIDPAGLVRLVQGGGGRWQLSPDGSMAMTVDADAKPIAELAWALGRLESLPRLAKPVEARS